MWMNTINAPYTNDVGSPGEPFLTEFTPLRVGVIYCWMLRETLQQDSWPGYILVKVYEKKW